MTAGDHHGAGSAALIGAGSAIASALWFALARIIVLLAQIAANTRK
jgi:hypothetical protein